MAPLCTLARDRVDMDTITCGAAISACEKGGEWGLAMAFVSRLATDRAHTDTITCATAISACDRDGERE